MGRIAAGSLTERISLLNAASLSDGQGGRLTGVAATPVVVWARKREVSATEVLRLGQVLGTRLVEFTIRYKRTLNLSTATRLTWEGRTFSIKSLINDDRHEFTTLTAVDNGRT